MTRRRARRIISSVIDVLLNRSARAWPDRLALVSDEATLTYAQLADRVARLGNALLGLGLEPGDRVADIQTNSHTYVETELACAAVGLVRVPVNVRLSRPEMEHVCRDAGVAGLLLGQEFGELGDHLRSVTDSVRTVVSVGGAVGEDYERVVADGAPLTRLRWSSPNDLVSVNYSSGTTGAPKGCLRTLRNRLASTHAMLVGVTGPLAADDVFLHAGPLTHASGLFMLPHLCSGATQVLLRKFDAERVVELIAEHRVTGTVLVPTMLERVVDAVAASPRGRLDSLRRVAYAGAPMPPDRIAHANEVLGGRLVQFYGMVEAIPPLTVLDADGHRVPELLASAGRPVPGAALRVVAEGGTAEAAPGETGELMVGGDHVMAGYWSNTEATTKSLVNGWLRTGDIARMDERGNVYLVDRRADMIITGGFNVMPREIEAVIEGHPLVAEAAVVGLPDREWGEAVTAFVVPVAGESPSADELRRLCADRLAAYKKPKRIELVKELPKGSTGKVSRAALRAAVAPADTVNTAKERS